MRKHKLENKGKNGYGNTVWQYGTYQLFQNHEVSKSSAERWQAFDESTMTTFGKARTRGELLDKIDTLDDVREVSKEIEDERATKIARGNCPDKVVMTLLVNGSPNTKPKMVGKSFMDDALEESGVDTVRQFWETLLEDGAAIIPIRNTACTWCFETVDNYDKDNPGNTYFMEYEMEGEQKGSTSVYDEEGLKKLVNTHVSDTWDGILKFEFWHQLASKGVSSFESRRCPGHWNVYTTEKWKETRV